MSSVPFDINSAEDTVDLSIQTMFIKDLSDVTEYHKSYYYTEDVQDLYVKDSSLSQITSYGRRVENQRSRASSPVQGFDKTYTQNKYDGMFVVTEKMWKFGIQLRQLQSIVKTQMNRAKQVKEQALANVLNNSTSTSYTDTSGDTNYTVSNIGGDGAAPFSASHTREDGGTNWSNIVTGNPVYSYSAMKTANTVSQAILGPVGEILDMNLDTYVFKKNSAAYFKAMEILGAIRRNEIPNSADNDGSGLMAFKIIANPYLTDPLKWWAFDSSKTNGIEYGLQLKQSHPLRMLPADTDYITGEIRYKVEEYYDYGFNDMRPWVYSAGTGS